VSSPAPLGACSVLGCAGVLVATDAPLARWGWCGLTIVLEESRDA
jgi:hypothetical protein